MAQLLFALIPARPAISIQGAGFPHLQLPGGCMTAKSPIMRLVTGTAVFMGDTKFSIPFLS